MITHEGKIVAKQENNTQTVTATVELLNKGYDLYTCLAEDANHRKITYSIKLRKIGISGYPLASVVVVVVDSVVTFCRAMSRVGGLSRAGRKLELLLFPAFFIPV